MENMTAKQYIDQVIENVKKRNANEPEFIQAAEEILPSLEPIMAMHPEYMEANLLERFCEPERQIMFKVTWRDDQGKAHVNRGFRVQFNGAIGPYKGGLRFHPSVNIGIVKFLGLEQILKNSLTGLPIGGGKGGSDFDPRGRSDAEIMRFCQAFMTELYRHIGPDVDVPAGDIGVGGREIGFMYGMYKKLARENTGVLTGKGRNWGGSILRPEATGFGGVYFVDHMLKKVGKDIKGKTVALSGFGNVAWGAALKATELGAKVVCISGPDGYIYDEAGIAGEKIDYMNELLQTRNNVVAPFATKYPTAKFFPGQKPWVAKVDIAMPCAIQNELNAEDAKQLIANGVQLVCEVSNMGCTADAIHELQKAGISFAPGKAANAGGVAVSGLEMTQNAAHLGWTPEEVDAKLKQIMTDIHHSCVQYGTENNGYINYVKGANIAGFIKVADSMIDLGVC